MIKRVFRGICFRVTEDERAAQEEANRDAEQRMGLMPVTQHRTIVPDCSVMIPVHMLTVERFG